MTTIILTIIGILLAALAALMIIFYGGSAFNAGSVKAQANTLQNAGTNVISAYDLAQASGKSVTSMSDLTTADANNGGVVYLKAAPALPSGVTETGIVTADNAYEVTGVSTTAGNDVCSAINTNLQITPAAIGDGKMGCYQGTFYAVL